MKNLILLSFLLPAVALGQAFAPSGVAISATNFTGSLSGDVSGTQSATVVDLVGGVSAANVAAGVNLANAATSANTASTIVKRDGSGNFSATTITANLTGNASGSSGSFTGSLVGDVTGTQGATVLANIPASVTATSTSGTTITSSVANSGSNVAYTFTTSNTLSGSTSLVDFISNGTTKLSIDNAGGLCLNGHTCTARVWQSAGQMVLNTANGSSFSMQTDSTHQVQSYYAMMMGQQRANQLVVDGSNASANATLTTQGSDTNIGISLVPKGTGQVTASGAVLSGNTLANQLTINGSAASSAVTETATGSDTNIGISLVPKGSGRVTTAFGYTSTFASGNSAFDMTEGSLIGFDGTAHTSTILSHATTHGFVLLSNVANSGTNSAFIFQSNNTLTTSTLLSSWLNGATTEFTIDIAGAAISKAVSGNTAFQATEGAYIGLNAGSGGSWIQGNATTHGVGYSSNATNSGSNAAFVFNSNNTLSGSTLLVDWQNNTTSKASLEDDGTFNGLGFHATGSTHAGTITLSAATTGTATVVSGCKPLCTNTTTPTAVQCTVSSTTLTATELIASSDAINYFCF